MMWKSAVMVIAAAITCFGQSANAPDNKSATNAPKIEKKFYKFNFVVRELEGEQVINSRSYSIIMSNDTERDHGQIRAGEKVPFDSGSGSGTTQWQLINVGVNIDCSRVRELGERLAVRILADISSVATARENGPPSPQPIIRNNQWESEVLLPLRQPTVLYSSDDPASKRKMQLQVTVTPVE